jgi:NAD(P)H-hydrate epimerase
MPESGLYTIAQMRAADAAAIAAGVPGITLMENAGTAVADVIIENYAPGKTVVLAGPGNNGGDGFVIARRLSEAGWLVEVALLGSADQLAGDAALARNRWQGPIETLEIPVLDGAVLVVDALFGAGLTRPVEGIVASVLQAANEAGIPIVSVDVPSGIEGDTGAVLGMAPKAETTVTFHRAKPGHHLLPGREHVGRLVIADIGIPSTVDDGLGIDLFANSPELWRAHWPRRKASGHKYDRGHALVLGGGMASSGAARLAARAALRTGTGLVTVLCPASSLPTYAASLTAVMVRPFSERSSDFQEYLNDSRQNAILLGPGAGVGEALCKKVEASLKSGKAAVLDADALTSFAGEPARLFEIFKKNPNVLMTPHEGEFSRLFGGEGDKLSRARQASAFCGATVLLKGADTVVAGPDGRASILTEAPSTLATAGSGDVLAGIALGLLAQSMPIFDAASAAAWLHAEAARAFGPGLIAEDLADQLPGVFSKLESRLA